MGCYHRHHLRGVLQNIGPDKAVDSETVSLPGLFEIHGTAVVPTVSVVAPEKLSASTRRRYETQVRGRVSQAF